MKKIVSALVALVLVLLPVLSLADIDLSGYSTAKLIDIRGQILIELRERGDLISFEVPVGYFVVGMDIPAGDYYVTPTKRSTIVSVYSNSDRDDFLWYGSVDSGDRMRATLTDGQMIEVAIDPAMFKTYTGITINIDK